MSKKIKVYYINHPFNEDAEENSPFWQRYLTMTTGYTKKERIPLKKDYRKVLDFELDEDFSEDEILNKLWEDCQNIDWQKNAAGDERSMMVGDVIEIENKLFLVDSIGFSETEWA